MYVVCILMFVTTGVLLLRDLYRKPSTVAARPLVPLLLAQGASLGITYNDLLLFVVMTPQFLLSLFVDRRARAEVAKRSI